MKHLQFAVASLLILLFVNFSCTKKITSPLTSHDGVAINFVEKGEGDISLLLIHGWSNNYTIWDQQIEHFSKKYKVVAIDLPGFGKSGSNRENWSVTSFGNDIKTIISELQLKNVVVVGFSMGAGVAVEAAKGEKNDISGIVLVENLQNIEMRNEPHVFAFMDSVFTDLVNNPTKEKLVGLGFVKKNPDESYDKVVAMLNGPSRIGWSESFKEYFNWMNESCIDAIKSVEVPIISINSDAQPTNVEAFNKYATSYNLKTISDSGHVLMWDQTEEFNRLLEESIQELFEQ